ncbi:hypothetical protein CLU79DRAFT_549261 [Phycomyces nitens]|nr:hypothetical protein CLU79DRAFT_549261 [Phycomyces nitens]
MIPTREIFTRFKCCTEMSASFQTSMDTAQASPKKDPVDEPAEFMSLFTKLEDTCKGVFRNKREFMDDGSIWLRIYRGLVVDQSEQLPFVKDEWFMKTEFSSPSWIFLQKLVDAPNLTLFIGEFVFLLRTVLDYIDNDSLAKEDPKATEIPITSQEKNNNGPSLGNSWNLTASQQKKRHYIDIWVQQGDSVIKWLNDKPTFDAIECLVDSVSRIVKVIDEPREKWTVETNEEYSILKQFTAQDDHRFDLDNLIRVFKAIQTHEIMPIGIANVWQEIKTSEKDKAHFFRLFGSGVVCANESMCLLIRKAIRYIELLISPFPGGFSPAAVHQAKQLGRLVFWDDYHGHATLNDVQYAKSAFQT